MSSDERNGEPRARKPDPDEPWRYACPDCGSVDLAHVPTSLPEARFRCGYCFWYGPESALVDRRE